MSHITVTEQTHIPNSDRNTERNVPVVRRRTLAGGSQNWNHNLQMLSAIGRTITIYKTHDFRT